MSAVDFKPYSRDDVFAVLKDWGPSSLPIAFGHGA
jgi:hypothetical protein